MFPVDTILSLIHHLGLALGLGCATAKLVLLFKCKGDPAFLPTYVAVSRPITRLIILGLILLVLSGGMWLVLGYPFSTVLVIKLVLVAIIWVLGPIIDNVIEPKFLSLAPAAGESPSPAFLRIQQQYLLMELAATGLFYVIVVMWMLA